MALVWQHLTCVWRRAWETDRGVDVEGAGRSRRLAPRICLCLCPTATQHHHIHTVARRVQPVSHGIQNSCFFAPPPPESRPRSALGNLISLAARHTFAYVAGPAHHAPQSPRRGCIRREPVSSASSAHTTPLRSARQSLMARLGSAGPTLKPIGQVSPLAQEQTSSTSPAPSTLVTGFDALNAVDIRGQHASVSGSSHLDKQRLKRARRDSANPSRPLAKDAWRPRHHNR
ncbi:hypothetical protein IWZ03DRAFT_10884 [Phyllosticta citriasiana]|uniref:Uncharacterized protein n=1 Tax=Phyllosticta citriasiana TaxID=595635 RepID=A0ABR1KY65_9PEZI